MHKIAFMVLVILIGTLSLAVQPAKAGDKNFHGYSLGHEGRAAPIQRFHETVLPRAYTDDVGGG